MSKDRAIFWVLCRAQRVAMKKCKCGQMIASNARVCPHCGNRFTHPFVKGLAWLMGITVVLFWITLIVGSRHPSTQTTSGATPPDAVANPIDIPIKSTKDEAAFVIKQCGRPDRDFLVNVSPSTAADDTLNNEEARRQ